MWAPLFALQAPLFPLRHSPSTLPLSFFRSRPPCASPSVTPPPPEGRDCLGGGGGYRASIVWVLARSSIPLPFVQQGEEGVVGARGLRLLWVLAIRLLPPSWGLGWRGHSTHGSPLCLLTLTGGIFQPSNSWIGQLGYSPRARWHLPAIQLTRLLAGWEALPEPGSVFQPSTSFVCWPAHALPVYIPLGVEIFVKSVAVSTLGLGDLAFAPRPVHRPVGNNALAVTRHAFPLLVCSLVDPS